MVGDAGFETQSPPHAEMYTGGHYAPPTGQNQLRVGQAQGDNAEYIVNLRTVPKSRATPGGLPRTPTGPQPSPNRNCFSIRPSGGSGCLAQPARSDQGRNSGYGQNDQRNPHPDIFHGSWGMVACRGYLWRGQEEDESGGRVFTALFRIWLALNVTTLRKLIFSSSPG